MKATLLLIALAALAVAGPLAQPAAAADTCDPARLACVVDGGYGSRACDGAEAEHRYRGVKVAGELDVVHTRRCSDAPTYHQESDQVRVRAAVVSASVQRGSGWTEAGGANEGTFVSAYTTSFTLPFVKAESYDYRNDARDECRGSVRAAGTTLFDGPCATRLPSLP